MKIFSKNTWGVDVNNAWPLTCKASCLKKIELRPLISGFDFALLEVRNLCVASRLHCKTHSPTFQNAHFIWGEITLLSKLKLYNLIFDNDKYQAYKVSSKSCHHKQFLYKRQKCMCRQWKMLQVASSQWNIKWNGT